MTAAMFQGKPIVLLIICVFAAFGITVASMSGAIPPWVGAIICLPLGLLSAPAQVANYRGRSVSAMGPTMGIFLMLGALVLLIALPIFMAPERTLEGILTKNLALPIIIFIGAQNLGVGFMVFRGIGA